MSFFQRLSKSSKKYSQENEDASFYRKQLVSKDLEDNRKYTQFSKHHTDLKSILSYLEKQKKSVNSANKQIVSSHKIPEQTQKIRDAKSGTKENDGVKFTIENSPLKKQKIKFRKNCEESEALTFQIEPFLLKNLKCKKTKSYNNPEVCTPLIKKPTLRISETNFLKKGLPNIGNTCYINSILQCLFHLKQLNEGFKNQQKGNSQILSKYLNLYDGLSSENSQQKDLSTLPLKMSVSKICSLFVNFHQQDAHQFLKKLLDSIHNQINKVKASGKYQVLSQSISKKNLSIISQQYWRYYKRFDDSYIYDEFCGQIYTSITCSNCKQQSTIFDNFLDFSLPMSKGKNSLEELLKDYFDEQILTDFYFCSSCKKSSKKSKKRSELWRTPNYLIIHLKRSQFGRKNNDKIKIPVRNLNLKQYIHSQKSSKSCTYTLQSLVMHRGIIEGGHYWSNVKQNLNWYSIDDEKVQKLPRDSFISNLEEEGSESAYILFYKCM